jgi:hypothetical protein
LCLKEIEEVLPCLAGDGRNPLIRELFEN